jgi:hypothetical protein
MAFRAVTAVSWPIYVLTQAKLHPNDPLFHAFQVIDWRFILPLAQPLYSDKGTEGYCPIGMFKALLLHYVCACKGKCQCLRNYSDPDAQWGHKTKTYTFFGYKIHLIIDVQSQLPLEVIVTSGEAADNTQAIPLLENTQKQHPELTLLSAAMDSAYDDQAIYEHYLENEISPIIALNPRNTQGKTQIGNDLFRDEKGTYYCARTGLPLVKNGTEPKRKGRNKIVCSPTGCRKECPFREECCANSKAGKTFYLYPSKDLRLIALTSSSGSLRVMAYQVDGRLPHGYMDVGEVDIVLVMIIRSPIGARIPERLVAPTPVYAARCPGELLCLRVA